MQNQIQSLTTEWCDFIKKSALETIWSQKYSINTPHSKKLSDKLLELYFRLQITFCEFVEHVAIIFYVLQIQENIMVTIRVSLDLPIVFDRMRKTICQFYRKVTWKISIFLRTPLNCPSVKKYCPQSNQNIFAKKSPMNFIQNAPAPFIDQHQNALRIMFIRHFTKLLSRFFSRGSL